MKILYLCTDPGIPVLGRKGCSTHIRETIVALQELGHEVRLLCSNAAGDPLAAQGLAIETVEPPRSRKLGFDLRHILLDRRISARLEALIHDWQPDAIYERYSLYSRAGQRMAAKYKLPRLMELNAFLTKEQAQRIRCGWLARSVERSIIRKAPRVIVVSEPLRREVNELGLAFSAIAKMPMAVNLVKFNPAIDGSEVRRQHGLDDRFVIGYVGTLAGWHGIRLLYEMARELKSITAAPFSFLIVGGDDRKLEEHRTLAREQGLDDVIRFIGSVPHEDVPRHLRAMDAAIIPDTTYWSSPAKLFEYQASGIPVLAPEYPAILEALDNGVEGLIFTPRDIRAMAAAAQKMMAEPAHRVLMGEAARRRAEREHSWSHNAAEIIRIYGELGAPVGDRAASTPSLKARR